LLSSQGPDYGAGKLDARCLLYHRSADTSDLYFKIDVLELLPQAKVFSGEQLNLTTCIKWKKSDARDSLCKEFQLESFNGYGSVMGVIQFPLAQGDWDIQVEITDDKSRKKDIIRLRTEKQIKANHAHDFLCFNPLSGRPFFSNEILLGDSVILMHSSGGVDHVQIEHCDKELKLPPPPFSDSQSEVITRADLHEFQKVNRYHKFCAFRAAEGYYSATNGSDAGEGLSFVVTHTGLYTLSNPNDLAASLRYITTKSEYDLIMKSPELKKAIDNYWLECAGSKERARELISLYYGRVEYANRYFSSYTKGWRTDRGLIYIIYGPPREVYEDEQHLRWYYEDQGEEGVIVNFKKSYSNGIGWHYLIERSPNFKASWESRVQQWRQGKMYGKV
jgi:GWxTD domain-containing protein